MAETKWSGWYSVLKRRQVSLTVLRDKRGWGITRESLESVAVFPRERRIRRLAERQAALV
jgi:hypothetical protein